MNIDSQLAKRFCKQGRLDDCPIIDFHAHMWGHWGSYMPACEPEDMLKQMNACNTVLTCFCGHTTYNTTAGETRDMKVAVKYPVFKPYHAVVSRYLNAEEDLRRMEENKDIFIGFKFHGDSSGVPITDVRHTPYWEYADRNRLLVLSHTWGGTSNNGPDEVEQILKKYNNLVFLAGHSFFDKWDKAAELSNRYENLYLELTAVLSVRGPLEYLVEKAGSERILFGVDLPWFSYFHGIGAVMSAEITDEQRRNILYRNGKKILSRFNWFHEFWKEHAPGVK